MLFKIMPQTSSYFRQVIFLVFFNILSISCDEESASAIHLTTDDFNKDIGTNNYFVMFYAPWCSYCVKLKPTWEELAEMLNEPDSRVTIAKVDCTVDSGICTQQKITSYPTLLYYKKGSNLATKYGGTRDLSSLANFLNYQLGSNVVEHGTGDARPSGPIELTDETYVDHLAKGKHFIKFFAPWCGHCQNLSPTWENIGLIFSPLESVTIGKVDCTVHKEACRTYDIKSYPTLLWIVDGQKIEKYQGARTVEDLEAFVQEKLTSEGEKIAVPEAPRKEQIPSVIPLFGDNFKDGIAKGLTFVKYFAPWCGHCKGLAPTWQDLGAKFASRPDVTIADVDCTREENRQLCDDQDVEGFPTLVLYKNGERIDKYSGSRALTDLYDFVGKHFVDHDEL